MSTPDADPPIPPRLVKLRELVDYLQRAIVDTDHTESGLQGVSGLVGQYRAALVEIEQIEASLPDATKGTVLDEIAARRAASGPGRPAQRRVGR